MIARYRVLLPVTIAVGDRDRLSAHEYQAGAYSVRAYPPYQAKGLNQRGTAPSVPELRDAVLPLENPPAVPRVTVDGAGATLANALQIDFGKDDFDRTTNQGPPEAHIHDPPSSFLLLTANRLLDRLRSVLQSDALDPITSRAISYVQYLNDDGSDLAKEEGKHRGWAAFEGRFSVVALSPAQWNHYLGAVPEYEPPVWESMQLDALALLPQVGPAIVLAAAALETLIVRSLDLLIRPSGIPHELWSFMNDREQYWKEPSVNDRFTTLLHVTTGRSLKDKAKLWKAHNDLRYARNKFVHEGRCVTKSTKKGREVELNEESARKLINTAGEIIQWMEEVLPRTMRRLHLDAQPKVEMVVPVLDLARKPNAERVD